MKKFHVNIHITKIVKWSGLSKLKKVPSYIGIASPDIPQRAGMPENTIVTPRTDYATVVITRL